MEFTGVLPVAMAAEREGGASCRRVVLIESRMAAGLIGAGGGGTVSPGFRFGLARGGCGSSREAGGGVEEGGGGGGGREGEGGLLELA